MWLTEIYIYVPAEEKQLQASFTAMVTILNTQIQSRERERGIWNQTISLNAAVNVSFLMEPTTKHVAKQEHRRPNKQNKNIFLYYTSIHSSIHPLEQIVKHTGEMVKEFLNRYLFYFSCFLAHSPNLLRACEHKGLSDLRGKLDHVAGMLLTGIQCL